MDYNGNMPYYFLGEVTERRFERKRITAVCVEAGSGMVLVLKKNWKGERIVLGWRLNHKGNFPQNNELLTWKITFQGRERIKMQI